MKITIIAVGKIKESFYREALMEYSKRLSKYCTLNIIEVADEKTPDNISDHERELILEKESNRIFKLIPDTCYIIALCINGASYDSCEYSKHLGALKNAGTSHFCFIIGGSLGLHKSIIKRADEQLSFSSFTFPHQLMRVILLEQIYRFMKIEAGEPYHK